MPGCGAAQRRHVARRNSETTSMAHIGGRIGNYRRDGRVAEPDRHPPEPMLTRSPTSAPQNKPSSNVRLRTSLVPSSPRLCQVGGAKPVSGRSDPPYRYINKGTLNVGGGATGTPHHMSCIHPKRLGDISTPLSGTPRKGRRPAPHRLREVPKAPLTRAPVRSSWERTQGRSQVFLKAIL